MGNPKKAVVLVIAIIFVVGIVFIVGCDQPQNTQFVQSIQGDWIGIANGSEHDIHLNDDDGLLYCDGTSYSMNGLNGNTLSLEYKVNQPMHPEVGWDVTPIGDFRITRLDDNTIEVNLYRTYDETLKRKQQ
jgi:hypothetical protein